MVTRSVPVRDPSAVWSRARPRARPSLGVNRVRHFCMSVRRILPYHESRDFDATRAFYTRVLRLEGSSFGGGYIGFGSGQAQVVFAPPGR